MYETHEIREDRKQKRMRNRVHKLYAMCVRKVIHNIGNLSDRQAGFKEEKRPIHDAHKLNKILYGKLDEQSEERRA